MATFRTSSNPRNEIRPLSDALSKIGLTLPDAITSPPAPVKVDQPSSEEVAAAIIAAKGDPADKEVQRLITARAINAGGYTVRIEEAVWAEQRAALRAELHPLNEAIHVKFDTAAEELADVAPKLAGYAELDSIVLADLPARVGDDARRAVEAQATLRHALAAWTKLWVAVGKQQTGHPNSVILSACNPTPNQWHEHSSRAPQTLPAPGDVWGILRAGWKLDLAHDIRDAKARADHISRSIDGDREKRRLEKGRATSWGLYR